MFRADEDAYRDWLLSRLGLEPPPSVRKLPTGPPFAPYAELALKAMPWGELKLTTRAIRTLRVVAERGYVERFVAGQGWHRVMMEKVADLAELTYSDWAFARRGTGPATANELLRFFGQ